MNYTKKHQIITGSMLCASGRSSNGITDTCQGDSGGPLVCEEDGAFVLRGVTSWGQGCALRGFPGIYARVQSVISWVEDVMDHKVRLVTADDQQEPSEGLLKHLCGGSRLAVAATESLMFYPGCG